MHSAKTLFFTSALKASGHLSQSLPQQFFQDFLEDTPVGDWEPDILLFYAFLAYPIPQRLTSSRNMLRITMGDSALQFFYDF